MRCPAGGSCMSEGQMVPAKPTKGRRRAMILRWLLFETRLGELLLVCLERYVGLAVVQADWLASQPSGQPRTMSEVQ